MKRELMINGTLIDDDADCYVIAEIGHNHQGDLRKAMELFRRAHECGVDAEEVVRRRDVGRETRLRERRRWHGGGREPARHTRVDQRVAHPPDG